MFLGGPRGYVAITGQTAWSIALYVNSILIPVIGVERGVTYNIRVQSGQDASQGDEYHPFYITDSDKGGYAMGSPEVSKVT